MPRIEDLEGQFNPEPEDENEILLQDVKQHMSLKDMERPSLEEYEDGIFFPEEEGTTVHQRRRAGRAVRIFFDNEMPIASHLPNELLIDKGIVESEALQWIW